MNFKTKLWELKSYAENVFWYFVYQSSIALLVVRFIEKYNLNHRSFLNQQTWKIDNFLLPKEEQLKLNIKEVFDLNLERCKTAFHYFLSSVYILPDFAKPFSEKFIFSNFIFKRCNFVRKKIFGDMREFKLSTCNIFCQSNKNYTIQTIHRLFENVSFPNENTSDSETFLRFVTKMHSRVLNTLLLWDWRCSSTYSDGK